MLDVNELRQDFADDWARTQGFTISDPYPPLPSSALVDRSADSADEIIEAVARIGGVSEAEILGRRKHAWLCRYRAMAIMAVHTTLGKTEVELGRIFRRDPTTIAYTLKRIKVHMRCETWRQQYFQVVRASG